MADEEKLEKLLIQIIRKTTEGEIKWKLIPPPVNLRSGTDDLINNFFVANYKGKPIAVFERRFEGFIVEVEQTYWDSRPCFAFLSPAGTVIWETSELSTQIAELYDAAKESAADVDGILDSLLD